jgi:hypothetical protein
MRAENLNDGTLKTFLILVLLLANILLSVLPPSAMKQPAREGQPQKSATPPMEAYVARR